MLAKLWKKILLAVCLLACLFNITYKLVNRHSLKDNLQSVNNGETIFDLSRDKSTSGANSGSSQGNNSGNDSSNSGEDTGHAEHKNEGYYDEDGNYRLYRDDENSEAYANKNGNGDNDDENNNNDENQENESNGGISSINVKDAISNAKDKVKNVDIDVQPAEATEVYEDIPVYDEDDPQRNNGKNSEYEYTWRDFLDIFKSN